MPLPNAQEREDEASAQRYAQVCAGGDKLNGDWFTGAHERFRFKW